MMAEESMDFRNGWVRLCYNPDFDNLKEAYIGNLDKKLDQFSRFLGARSWYAGEQSLKIFLMLTNIFATKKHLFYYFSGTPGTPSPSWTL